MAGFGRKPFGRGPFGRSDTGGDLIVELFPKNYFDDSLVLDAGETLTDNNKDPLLKLLKTYAHQVFKRRLDVDRLPSLLDFEAMPLEIVRLWGDMLGLGIDKNDPGFLQRSFLGNASQWLQIKASTRGYEVRGLASGFDVAVDNFWRIDPVYEPLIPARFKYLLRPRDADPSALKILHTDQPPGSFAGTPTEEDETYAKSSYVRLVFTVHEPRNNAINYNALLDLVIDKIRDVVGIHHEMQAPQFLIRVPVDVTYANVDMLIEEFAVFNASVNHIYDITPADEVSTDRIITVTMSAGTGYVLEVDASQVTVTGEAHEFEGDPVLGITTLLSAAIAEAAEELLAGAGASITVDVSAGSETAAAEVLVSAGASLQADESSGPQVVDVIVDAFMIGQEFSSDVAVDAADHYDITASDAVPADSQSVTISLSA